MKGKWVECLSSCRVVDFERSWIWANDGEECGFPCFVLDRLVLVGTVLAKVILL